MYSASASAGLGSRVTSMSSEISFLGLFANIATFMSGASVAFSGSFFAYTKSSSLVYPILAPHERNISAHTRFVKSTTGFEQRKFSDMNIVSQSEPSAAFVSWFGKAAL